MDDLLAAFQANEFLWGGLSLMLVATAGMAVRYLPSLLWQLVWRYFGVCVTVRDQTMVRWLGTWLSEGEWGKKGKWLEATSVDEKDGFGVILRPGPGLHMFHFKGRRFYLSHELEQAGLAGKISVLTLRVLRPERALVSGLMEEIAKRANHERIGKTPVFINGRGYWDLLRLTVRREAETVFLAPGILDDVFRDADWFFASESWYRSRGLPYRRGYLLWGEPGNGKSTLVQALAAHCNTSVYSLSLADKEMGDSDLARAVGSVPPQALVVLEDIEKVELERTDVSLAGFLNAIDGPLASEGRIFIATANDLAPISASMLRPGRVDRIWKIGMPEPMAIEACISAHGLDGRGADLGEKALSEAWTMAKLQAELLAENRHWETRG